MRDIEYAEQFFKGSYCQSSRVLCKCFVIGVCIVYFLKDLQHRAPLGRTDVIPIYSLGQLGTSAHVAKNTSELLFGAPGVFNWKGDTST
jgi:hypothetical protein